MREFGRVWVLRVNVEFFVWWDYVGIEDSRGLVYSGVWGWELLFSFSWKCRINFVNF